MLMTRPDRIRPRPLKHDNVLAPRRPDDRVARLKALGLNVTICMAAAVLNPNCIVTISDRRISYYRSNGERAAFADEGTLKARKAADDWGVLFAGDDISPVAEIIDSARAELSKIEEPLIASHVQDALCAAYLTKVHELAAWDHLKRLGFDSVQEFRKRGLKQLGPKAFGRLSRAVEEYSLGLDLLVYGFEAGHNFDARIFEVGNPGRPRDHYKLGFGIIGSGFWPALSALTKGSTLEFLDLPSTVYRLCEAKFTADRVDPAVGKSTTLALFGPNGQQKWFEDAQVEELRTIWEETHKTPAKAVGLIETAVRDSIAFGENAQLALDHAASSRASEASTRLTISTRSQT